ncbi:MAG: signal peptidase I, partial [Chloroflexi bacterium RBG_16_58_8]
MKRTLVFIFIVLVCVMGFLSIRGTLPFMPIRGTSMLPELKAGDLISIQEISPAQVKVGDVIVFNVPPLVRQAYNYPPVVAHRVIKIIEYQKSVGFRTKGDNTSEDPFTVRGQDLKGTISHQFSGLGFPLLFFQSQQGLIFIVIALLLLAFFLYGGEIARGGNLLHRGIFAPVIREEKMANRALTRKIDATEQKMSATEQ